MTNTANGDGSNRGLHLRDGSTSDDAGHHALLSSHLTVVVATGGGPCVGQPDLLGTDVTPRYQRKDRDNLMPNAPRTPLKSFRIPEDLYREAQQIAADEDQSVSDVVRKALERYVRAGRKRRAQRGDV